jgi:polar amino acid transport system ATP-binding protein
VKRDQGTIRIDGEYLWHEETPGGLKPAGERHAPNRRAIGIVFQQFNLFPHMTALKNVREPRWCMRSASRAPKEMRTPLTC